MSSRITQAELENYLWESAVYLRTHIDAGSYKQYIFPLLFYKRICDVFDEERKASIKQYGKDFPENHRFAVPKGYHWNDIRKVSTDVGTAIKNAFLKIETANPDFLTGIFGKGTWTNKKRLTDELLKNLIEHFSSKTLSIANCPEDELGQGYEYLIKKFADDSGHNAQEFYTNRTVVHLMTNILKPQPGESVYDPTCGTGGMLISAIAYLKEQKKEWRNVKLYGQEINTLSSAIAKMNMFLHGIEDFSIENGDTLISPKFVQSGKLQQFDIVLANPPYSISEWDRTAFSQDKYGRNFLGTPPQGRADYAFFQHILKSLDDHSGRCAILFPHGVLFRDEEREMRKKLIEMDLIECVIGLGPDLFFNATMEACIVICKTKKDTTKKGKILLINAKTEVTRTKTQAFLEDEHIETISQAYEDFKDEEYFTKVITLSDIKENNYSLSIPLYIQDIHLDLFKEVAPIVETIQKVFTSDNILENFNKTIENVKQNLVKTTNAFSEYIYNLHNNFQLITDELQRMADEYEIKYGKKATISDLRKVIKNEMYSAWLEKSDKMWIELEKTRENL